MMLTHDAIVRAVRSIRYSSKRLRNQRRAASVNALAKAAGITRDTVYCIARTGRMHPATADKIRHALTSDRPWRHDLSGTPLN